NWGVYSTAASACSLIGSRVASGAMPPRGSGFSLGSSEMSLVAEWVRLGCPETKSNLPASCSSNGNGGASGSGRASGAPPVPRPPPPAPGTGTPPPPGTGTGTPPPAPGATVTITRARWDSESSTLRLEGTSSDPTATVVVTFGGRTETLTSQGGSFRAE